MISFVILRVLFLKLFYNFLDDEKVNLYGVEAGGRGIKTGQHAASLSAGKPGVLHGNKTYLIQTDFFL